MDSEPGLREDCSSDTGSYTTGVIKATSDYSIGPDTDPLPEGLCSASPPKPGAHGGPGQERKKQLQDPGVGRDLDGRSPGRDGEPGPESEQERAMLLQAQGGGGGHDQDARSPGQDREPGLRASDGAPQLLWNHPHCEPPGHSCPSANSPHGILNQHNKPEPGSKTEGGAEPGWEKRWLLREGECTLTPGDEEPPEATEAQRTSWKRRPLQPRDILCFRTFLVLCAFSACTYLLAPILTLGILFFRWALRTLCSLCTFTPAGSVHDRSD